MRGGGVWSGLLGGVGAMLKHLRRRQPPADPSVLSDVEIEDAIDHTERSVTAALRQRKRPRPSELLLLQHLRRPKTLLSRLREASFPLGVVVVGLALLTFMATARPPVTELEGSAQTSAVFIEGISFFGSESLRVQPPDGSKLLASGVSIVDSAACPVAQTEGGLIIAAERLTVPLYGTKALRLELTRVPPTGTGTLPTQTLSVTAATDMILDVSGVTQVGLWGSAAPCNALGELSLMPRGEDVILELVAVPGGALDDAMVLPPFRAASASFGRLPLGSGPETCALSAAQLTQHQDIDLLGVSGISKTSLPEGTCMDLQKGDWLLTVTPKVNTLDIRFSSSGAPSVANVDDGLPARHTTLTYLEIFSTDPGLGLILSGIAYVLTTIWGAAVLIKRVVS